MQRKSKVFTWCGRGDSRQLCHASCASAQVETRQLIVDSTKRFVESRWHCERNGKDWLQPQAWRSIASEQEQRLGLRILNEELLCIRGSLTGYSLM